MNTDAERYQRLKELFFAALESNGAERDHLLAEVRNEDPGLAGELAALLESEASATHDVFAPLSEGRRAETASASSASDSIGIRLGPYRILRAIGEGGMGRVFLAERVDDAYRQTVAIKLLRSPLLAADALARFRLERQALADLSHPFITRLLDGGETAEGLAYLVLEYVEGTSIDRFCDEHELDLHARLRLFLDVCTAVEHAHRRLIVHRDLKPSNILVTASGEVKLLDFGIAKLLPSTTAPEPIALTATLHRVLTPEFAAPEQVRGGVITTATDVYALGLLLHRLMTGRHPYDVSGTAAAFERTVCELPPTRPSAALPLEDASARRRARELQGDLDTIVLAALRKEPERRYGSVEALADDVRRHLEHQPVLARPDTATYRARKFARRHRAGVAAATVTAVALVTGAGVATWQAGRATRERDRAQSEAARAERISTFLHDALTAADPVRGGERAVTVAAILDDASVRLDRDHGMSPLEAAALRETLGQTYVNLGLTDEAEREYRAALATLQGADAPAARRARLHALLAVALNEKSRWDEAEAEARAALALLGSPMGVRGEGGSEPADDALRGLALDTLAVSLVHVGRNQEAIAAGRESVELLRRAQPPDPVALAAAVNNLAIAHGDGGDFAAAEPLHREALAIVRAARGDDHPQTAEALVNLASVVEMQGRLAEAEPVYREALAVSERLLGEGHYDYVRTLTSYANLLVLMDRPLDAVPQATRALDLARRHLGDGDQLTAYAANTLAIALCDTGRPEEAEPLAREALTSRERLLPPGHWLIESSRATLGAALLGAGRLEEAEPELVAAHRGLVEARGPDHEKALWTAELLARLASAQRASGQTADIR